MLLRIFNEEPRDLLEDRLKRSSDVISSFCRERETERKNLWFGDERKLKIKQSNLIKLEEKQEESKLKKEVTNNER